MSKTRNNHYVPQWYQEGFFEGGRNTLAYLDLKPPQRVLKDGRTIVERALFDAHTSRAFWERDLYSTFFGTAVNDEIERRLFGSIDARGSKAIRAFAQADVSEWHRHFQTLFEYLDVQKIRTPKGLDWLKAQYPALDQNGLMMEMQGIRMMHCTIWSEGVREIVSAEDSEVKFIFSDHPVTVYNHAVPPEAQAGAYPNDPAITQKASQTIFPLTRDFCLVLTNLEYAKNPSSNPLEKRTFPRHFRTSMVRTDAFIRTRKLTASDVARFNYIIKARAKRYIAAGRKEWLYPEDTVAESWANLKETLLPPEKGLWQFGGQMYAGYDDGRVHYQDSFGRTEKPRPFLTKDKAAWPKSPRDPCGCGSGSPFRACCQPRPPALRPNWAERGIRERNLMLFNAIVNILQVEPGRDWTSIRRDLTDTQISKIYSLYGGLWPLETDLLQLLPKPDGRARAVYTGLIHPEAIKDFALGASIYFDELIIQNPFVHPGIVKPEYSPVVNPQIYRQEFIKALSFFLTVIPLVEAGLVNLIPDPCDFDPHLRDNMFHMAKSRLEGVKFDPSQDLRSKRLMEEDVQRTIMSLPKEALQAQLRRASPEMGEVELERTLRYIETLKEDDHLAVLQQETAVNGGKSGQFNIMKLAPNFEITMYLAQATGSSIITDHAMRWREVESALSPTHRPHHARSLAERIGSTLFDFPQATDDILHLSSTRALAAYPKLIRDTFGYLLKVGERGTKANFEAHLASRFMREHSTMQARIKKAVGEVRRAKILCAFPSGGIQDNTINRLLLMSSSEHHLSAVPSAFFVEEHG